MKLGLKVLLVKLGFEQIASSMFEDENIFMAMQSIAEIIGNNGGKAGFYLF